LERTLERTRDNQIKVDLQRIQNMGELKAIALAILVERALYIQKWVNALGACAGVTKDK
jgi:hypothetical protein